MSGLASVLFVSIAFLLGWAFGVAVLQVINQWESEEMSDELVNVEESVELFQRWYPGGARENSNQLFEDGERYLFAIRMADESWNFTTITAKFDNGVWGFVDACDEMSEWVWTDVDWFSNCEDFDLPTD